MEIFLNIFLLIFGMFLLIKGADLFVEGSSCLAKILHIPSLIIGLTLVSIGTSLPELSVSLTASIQGMNDMNFGNIIGSNIFNTYIVIGVSAMITPLFVSKNMKKYDIPILCFIYLLLVLFSFVITPNILSLCESIILFILTLLYLTFLILRSKKESKQEKKNPSKNRNWKTSFLFIIIGLIAIIAGGQFVVKSASTIAIQLGMSELLVGLTIVAIGTSLPELTTSIVAAKKKENDIAIGNAIGSCIFNVLLILGLSSIIQPVKIANSSFVDVIVMLISGIFIFLFSWKKQKINFIHGFLLTLMYIGYLTYIILRNIYHF